MKKEMEIKASKNINKHKKKISITPKSSENFIWGEVNWRKIELRLNITQYKIYAAKQNNNIKKVRKLQRLILNSYDFKKIAVRKVTQLNRGKKSAGIDGIKNLNEKQRVWLVDNLRIKRKAYPLKRVMNPKHRGELRPVSVPTLYDRALQSLFLLALEPEFEAIFEANSYGFRPGRSAIDAMKQIHLCVQQAEKFVFNADVSKCFDKINHEKLLNLVGHRGRVRSQIQAWLKSGNIFEGTFEHTVSGTPQGDLLSPLLCNITLNGMEELLKKWAENQRLHRPDGVLLDSKNKRRQSMIFVRYANDLVVMNHDVSVVEKCKKIIGEFLTERGLELSEAKTEIVHTRKVYEKNPPGFEFLGFKIKHFNTVKHGAKNNQGHNIGYRILTFPTTKSRKKHFATIDSILRRYKHAKQSWVINTLNPIIIKWTNYFRFSHIVSTNIAASMEQILFNKLMYWAKRTLSAANNKEKPYDKFWHKTHGRRQFAYKNRKGNYVCISLYRLLAKNVSLRKYRKVKEAVSVYNGDLKYWSKIAITPSLRTKTKSSLLKRQSYKCLACKLIFLPTDVIETDHIIPIAKGGSHKISNLQLLHAVCHDKKKNL